MTDTVLRAYINHPFNSYSFIGHLFCLVFLLPCMQPFLSWFFVVVVVFADSSLSHFLISLSLFFKRCRALGFRFGLLLFSIYTLSFGDLTQYHGFKYSLGLLPWKSSGKDSALPMQGAWVQSLVRELGSPMLHSAAKN